MNLSAVRIFVRDIAEAKQFYTGCVGLSLKADGSQSGYCLFDAGSIDLVVEAVGPNAPEDEQILAGRFTGLSFSVGDIAARYEELTSAGVQFIGAPKEQSWGGWLATFKDPEGNELQLVQYPSGFSSSGEIGSPIRWRMHIPVSPEAVFAALDSDRGRASFWAESAVEVDEHIEFQFINGYTCRSKVLERRPPEVLAIDYMGGTARFELASDGRGGTDLLLTHGGTGPEEWHEIHAGWLNVLFPLKAWLAHHVDLRNHDPSRSWDQGYADQ